MIMADNVLSGESFFIYLTIDGTDFEDVEVRVTRPDLPIREQIRRIIDVFKLRKTDNFGNFIPYLLGQVTEDEVEPIILESEDELGNSQSLLDYQIKSGDALVLTVLPYL